MPTIISTDYAAIYGSPGARSRGLGLLKSLWPIGIILFGMGYLVRAALPFPEMPYWIISLLFIVVAVGMAAATNQARTKISNHTKGARGEELAARILSRLPAAYTVFHGVTIRGGIRDFEGGADIDHVVLAPHALYVIETKHWHGNITCENDQLLQDNILPDRDPIDQTLRAAKRIESFLVSEDTPCPVPIVPVLLFTTTEKRRIPQTLRGVLLTDLQKLTESITHPEQPATPARTQPDIIEILARHVEP